MIFGYNAEYSFSERSQQTVFENLDITPKGVIGVILLVICFIYILRRPGMSMMDNLKDHQKKRMEKQAEVREGDEKAESAPDGAEEDSVREGKTGR